MNARLPPKKAGALPGGMRLRLRGEQILPSDEIWVGNAWRTIEIAHRNGLTQTAPGRHVGRATPPVRHTVLDPNEPDAWGWEPVER